MTWRGDPVGDEPSLYVSKWQTDLNRLDAAQIDHKVFKSIAPEDNAAMTMSTPHRTFAALLLSPYLVLGCTEAPTTLPAVNDVTWNYETRGRPDIPLPDGGIKDVSSVDTTGETLDSSTETDGPTTLWSTPACATITASTTASFTTDEGASLALREITPTTTIKGGGIIVMAEADTLLATAGSELYLSSDAGCVWTKLGDLVGSTNSRLSAGPGPIAWAWSPGNNVVHQIDISTSTIVDVSPTVSIGTIVGFAADRSDGNRARLVAQDGRIYVTVGGGTSWIGAGTTPLALTAARSAAFHPTNTLRAIVGFEDDGFLLTTDGGASWTNSTGLALLGNGEVHGSSVLYSTVNADVVWAIATDKLQTLTPSKGRHLYRSGDGGATFVPVVDHSSAGTIFVEGGLLASHPTDPMIVYAFFGTAVDGYGTDVYRYSHSSGVLVTNHNDAHGIGGVAFNPSFPNVMYVVEEFDPES